MRVVISGNRGKEQGHEEIFRMEGDRNMPEYNFAVSFIPASDVIRSPFSRERFFR